MLNTSTQEIELTDEQLESVVGGQACHPQHHEERRDWGDDDDRRGRGNRWDDDDRRGQRRHHRGHWNHWQWDF